MKGLNEGVLSKVREASRRRFIYPESDDDIGWETDSDAGSNFQQSDDFLGFEERDELPASDDDDEDDSSFDEGKG